MTEERSTEPKIRRRIIEPPPEVITEMHIRGVQITLDDLKQVKTILQDYVSASPQPKYDFSEDRRSLKIEALTADMDSVVLVPVLNADELRSLKMDAITNDSAIGVLVRFGEGGDLSIYSDSRNTEAGRIAELLEQFFTRNKPSRWTRKRLKKAHATFGIGLPLLIVAAYVTLLLANQAYPYGYLIIAFQIFCYFVSRYLFKLATKPTIIPRSYSEISADKRLTRANKITIALSIASIGIAIGVAATR